MYTSQYCAMGNAGPQVFITTMLWQKERKPKGLHKIVPCQRERRPQGLQ
jgi:hypothetical protein